MLYLMYSCLSWRFPFWAAMRIRVQRLEFANGWILDDSLPIALIELILKAKYNVYRVLGEDHRTPQRADTSSYY